MWIRVMREKVQIPVQAEEPRRRNREPGDKKHHSSRVQDPTGRRAMRIQWRRSHPRDDQRGVVAAEAEAVAHGGVEAALAGVLGV